jgi:1,4-dihydroxy-2-naphthoate octaprenyltransferase
MNAVRLQYYPTTALILVVGVSVSRYLGVDSYTAVVFMVVGNFLLHCSCSLINEYADFVTGADQVAYPETRWKATGGSRVLVDGLLSQQHVLGVSLLLFFLSFFVWSYLAVKVDYVLIFGVVFSFGTTYLYAAAFSKGGFHYVRELLMAFGAVPVIVVSVVRILSGEYAVTAAAAGGITGMQLMNYLVYHGVLDMKADSESGKKRLTRALGLERSLYCSGVLTAGTFVGLGVLLYTGVFPPGCAVAGILVGLAARIIYGEMKKDIRYYTHVVLLFIGTAGLLSLGFWL